MHTTPRRPNVGPMPQRYVPLVLSVIGQIEAVKSAIRKAEGEGKPKPPPTIPELR